MTVSSVYNALFAKLARRYPTPRRVQRWLRSMPYNREIKGETLRSAAETLKAGTAHCLEATFLAAAVLERRGHPPLVLSLESQDGLDHVIYVFREKGRWGAIARSRDEGLHGRAPRFRSLRDLAFSYVDPYVDGKGRVTGFGLAHLDAAGADWRASPRFVWKVERYLIDLPHQRLPTSDLRYRKSLKRLRKNGPLTSGPGWW
jgi:hypothetical protein